MKIYSYQKVSFVDYPGVISCVIFTPFCNFNCWYCHNSEVILNSQNNVEESEVLNYLKERKKLIDAVVVSGGEPTFQTDLIDFLKKLKNLGYKVKLDTNGSQPSVLKKVLDSKLVDFVAMDLKAPLNKYRKITCSDADIKNIKESINLLKKAENIDVEFRTTFSPDLTIEDIGEIAKLVGKKHNYAIQQYVKHYDELPDPHLEETVAKAYDLAKNYAKNVTVKGLKTNVAKKFD